MPSYLYRCIECREEKYYWHEMQALTVYHCPICQGMMVKVPAGMPAVNWGGPPPSAGGKHPIVEELNATYDERRDAFAKKKEEHVKRTEGENDTAAEVSG